MILSSDVRTWKFNQPVLFLGKWCLREQDKHIWKNMDAVVSRPIGIEGYEREILFQEAREIESRIFPIFTKILNQFHGVNYGERFWYILIGHWFRASIDILINRVNTIERCFAEHHISSTVNYTFSKSILAGLNYTNAMHNANDNYWNTQLFTRIISLLGLDSIKIETITPEAKRLISNPIKNTQSDSGKQRLFGICRLIASKLTRDRDALIVNSYLPLQKQFLLDIALGQFPQWRLPPRLNVSAEINENARAFLSRELEKSFEEKLERIVSSLLFELIPICYLEGFGNLAVQASELKNWPRNPKFILSSNNFVSDEVFKAWTAKKVSEGTPYFAGQHGNNYGTNKYLGHTIEEVTSDKFLTWGWKRGLPQHTPAFIFKNVSGPKVSNLKGERIILIENLLTVRTQVWEQAEEFERYMAEQFRFVSGLGSSIREKLTVRLHAAHSEMLGEDDLRWRNFDKSINLDSGKDPIRKLWQENKIIVHSYDSTGLLETLEANIPTVAFWQNGLEHLVDEAIPYYGLLVDVGIVQLTPESAAFKINEVWDDVEKWWRSREVQQARDLFCAQYARTSKNPIRELKKIILGNVK